MPRGSLVVPYRRSRGGDRALAQALGEAERSGRELRVLVPFVVPPDTGGCCGIRGQAWVSMLREAARDEAGHARHLLPGEGASALVEVVEGDSVPGILSAYMAADDTRQLALPSGGRGGPFSRAVSRRTARALPTQPVELDG